MCTEEGKKDCEVLTGKSETQKKNEDLAETITELSELMNAGDLSNPLPDVLPAADAVFKGSSQNKNDGTVNNLFNEAMDKITNKKGRYEALKSDEKRAAMSPNKQKDWAKRMLAGDTAEKQFGPKKVMVGASSTDSNASTASITSNASTASTASNASKDSMTGLTISKVDAPKSLHEMVQADDRLRKLLGAQSAVKSMQRMNRKLNPLKPINKVKPQPALTPPARSVQDFGIGINFSASLAQMMSSKEGEYMIQFADCFLTHT